MMHDDVVWEEKAQQGRVPAVLHFPRSVKARAYRLA
jgi:hypothetical protein